MIESPHAPGIEKSVLSSILRKPELLEDYPTLSPDHFHLAVNRVVFEQATESINKGLSLEMIGFIQQMHDSGLLDQIGGPSALTEIFGYTPNAAHFLQHCRVLTQKLALRKALRLGGEIEEAVTGDIDPSEVAEMLANCSTSVSDTLAESKPPSDTRALLRAAAQRWEALATGEEDPAGIQTSLAEINNKFRGLKPRRVTVISALPSQGKTLLGGQLFMDSVSQGNSGLFLTWEMSEDELIDRFLAYQAGTPINAVTDPIRYSQEIWKASKPANEVVQKMKLSFRKVAEMPLKVRAMHGQTITQAIAAIRREHRKNPLKLVVLDFIQRIGPARGMEKQPYERQLADIADRFQNLAQELGFHGIVLSQLNKDGAAKHAEAINESCALHLKIVKILQLADDKTPMMDGDKPKIRIEGIGVVKDRFHGQTGTLLHIGLCDQMQVFKRIENHPIK